MEYSRSAGQSRTLYRNVHGLRLAVDSCDRVSLPYSVFMFDIAMAPGFLN